MTSSRGFGQSGTLVTGSEKVKPALEADLRPLQSTALTIPSCGQVKMNSAGIDKGQTEPLATQVRTHNAEIKHSRTLTGEVVCMLH